MQSVYAFPEDSPSWKEIVDARVKARLKPTKEDISEFERKITRTLSKKNIGAKDVWAIETEHDRIT